ncbi:FAD-dependent oxygenase [Streptomyces lunaelactis]|uniref:FAD-dependent oxygenase n=1 Tax=Streptomyces lunaelactis TaxID=1535768 RepID=A0A2H5BVC2_9ACTN|nr:bagremycin/ferroverdin biosynthesis FAD-dependent oxygenase BagG/FevA2 [Streptomyces lunaelactis]AUG90781.1 putative FAD-dependent oxygenase [Streptomyces lunaelactis]AVZ74335.1 FAD-dependent oxygenase [Streptomyces lunaelactis]NUK85667.1 FAD-binding oxidoreductase [Streptomyces lunaelactis]
MTTGKSIARPAAAELAERLRGRVLRPGDDDFALELEGFNPITEHDPDLIAIVTGAADVREAVAFAAGRQLPISIQATGHGPSTPADGGLLISTRRLRGVSIDPVTRIARVEGGTQWFEVIQAAAEYGLAPLSGSSPLTGVIGYTLGGGLGLMARRYGYAADRVTALEIVTADGQSHRATPEHDTDLFWAVRGGKGNFGVVTAVEFELVPVSRLYGGGLFFAGEASADVLHAWREWTASVPEELTSSLALLRMPDIEAIPPFLRGRLTVHIRIAYLGSAEDGDRLVAPLRAAGPLVVDTLAEIPYTRSGEIHNDPTEPIPYSERSMMLRVLDEAAVDGLLELAGPGADCIDLVVELRQLGGAAGRSPKVPNAVDHRDAAFALSTLSLPDDRPPLVVDGMAPWGTGLRYLNFLASPDTAVLAESGYEPATFARLAEIKARADPDNLFRFNHNIVPRPLRA